MVTVWVNVSNVSDPFLFFFCSAMSPRKRTLLIVWTKKFDHFWFWYRLTHIVPEKWPQNIHCLQLAFFGIFVYMDSSQMV